MGAKKKEDPQNKTNVAGLKVLAAQTLKIASINGLGALDKLENELEDELNYENRSPAKTAFGRFRRAGEHQLHSKVVLFVVVLLNIIDTVLVMIGLILDFHHATLTLGAKSDMLGSFTKDVSEKYDIEKNESLVLQSLLNAHIIFNSTSRKTVNSSLATSCAHYINRTAGEMGTSGNSFFAELLAISADSTVAGVCEEEEYEFGNKTLAHNGMVENTLTVVTHKLHYCSIAILSILVIILIFKVVCFGSRIFKERMLIFDGLITIISFILDIVFINGVSFFSEEQAVIILSLLFPWRVIRILNSLIAAVLDKHKLNLKILYTQKKKITRSLTETNMKVELLQRHVETLQSLCSSRGIRDSEVRRVLENDSKNGSGGGGGLANMMALGKLAFQAADAFAPLSNGGKKDKADGSSSTPTSGGTSPQISPSKEGNKGGVIYVNDNNNAVIKNQNSRNASLDLENLPAPENPNRPNENEGIFTIHLNGSGPPRASDSAGGNVTRINLPDSEKPHHSNESYFDSRL